MLTPPSEFGIYLITSRITMTLWPEPSVIMRDPALNITVQASRDQPEVCPFTNGLSVDNSIGIFRGREELLVSGLLHGVQDVNSSHSSPGHAVKHISVTADGVQSRGVSEACDTPMSAQLHQIDLNIVS